MRELTMMELNEVSGGCNTHPSCSPRPACNPHPSCTPGAASIAAYAGYLAGEYNVQADIFNHASCSTISSAQQNVYTDTKMGYTAGLSMTVCQATTLLNNVVSAIHSAVSLNQCGYVTAMSTIDFPPNTTGNLG
ncbi:hypothetical protein [Acetobacter fallax]|uniref:Uncharacterized protein n=1 Tax=Acetobacter fallax TaxID=1737473 RepID=A0ABX0KB13_9PROT|nr:hypothetical protein [Acetobacter fallax]NHO32391.1 hypothetical protein [Acetobacter fallax]NHO35941.1 hypothetical protein [Acetobacter fallax]